MLEDPSVTEADFAMRDRISIARRIDSDGPAQDMNSPADVGGSVGGGVSVRALIDLCLVENDRRMAGYDLRLLRPTTVPRLAKLVRRLLPDVALPASAARKPATVRASGLRG